MPDLSSMLMRRSLGALDPGRTRCASCKRTPLAGERMHEMDSGRMLCDLCCADLPEERRRVVRSERVHASDRHLSVVSRAA